MRDPIRLTKSGRPALWLAAILALLLSLTSRDGLLGSIDTPTPPAETVTSVPSETLTEASDEETSKAPTEDATDESSDESERDTIADPETDHEETAASETTPCTHTPAPIPSVAPTCTEAGKTEGSICTHCGEILTEQTLVPPTGHAYTDFLCTVCGHQALCPTPVLLSDGEITIAFGTPLTLTWRTDGTLLSPPVYTLTIQEEESEEITLLADTAETAHTLTLPHEGRAYTLRLYALYADESGKGIPATADSPAELTVTVPLRPKLDPPAFLTGDMTATYAGKSVTVSWTPAEAEAEIRYTVTLTTPDGSETTLSADGAETSCDLDSALLSAEGIYTLTVTAKDPAGAYLVSDPASVRIQVKSPEAEAWDAFLTPARYHSDYYYGHLSTLPNAHKLQSFYRALDGVLSEFHSSDTPAQKVSLSDGSYRFYAAKVNYSAMGLTLEEAALARMCYVYDHPLYYWLSNVYVYTSNAMYICVDEAYATGSARAACNAMIYSGARDMALDLWEETSPYRIALAFYDRILATADYAYEEDGETPQDDPWAHNILGVFDPDRRAVVCEGFAEAYSLMLNFYGVENFQVPGVSRGVGHLWNLVRMDNGEWYWCDITWDDPTKSPLGTDYKYFLVTDTQDVLYYYVRDGIEAGYDYTFTGSATFMDDHTIEWEPNLAPYLSSVIPARAETPYEGSDPTLRETFTVDGMTYAVVGFDKVQLVDAGSKTRVTVPESVAYGGHSYTVYAIGLISEDGIYMKGRLLPLFTTSVYIPKTVAYIWDKALDGILVNIKVDPENPYYTVKNGQLVTKG